MGSRMNASSSGSAELARGRTAGSQRLIEVERKTLRDQAHQTVDVGLCDLEAGDRIVVVRVEREIAHSHVGAEPEAGVRVCGE
jgi:hypothetical protein